MDLLFKSFKKCADPSALNADADARAPPNQGWRRTRARSLAGIPEAENEHVRRVLGFRRLNAIAKFK